LTNNLAILGLGINTFHLLIVEITANNYKIVYNEKKFVKLGEFGLGNFNERVIDRAAELIKYYQEKIIKEHAIKEMYKSDFAHKEDTI